MLTPLARVRGLGSAKEGTHHFWWQRLTALALVPLAVFCVIGLLTLTAAGQNAADTYNTARAWIAHPVVAVLVVVTIAMVFHHGQLGLQVVIEDYIHAEWIKLTALLTAKFAAVVFALIGILAVLRIAVGG
ncbi:MAG: succinate dehydrogenase, hydrophobic membrane anchor protein [Gammaproteobacteria bacterium]|nr:succinate dehydrogenase, hydrophobic membrane anchor protein [Gammaproteobacteria bacterium]